MRLIFLTLGEIKLTSSFGINLNIVDCSCSRGYLKTFEVKSFYQISESVEIYSI